MELAGQGRLSPLHIAFLDWSGREVRRIDKVPTDEQGSYCGYSKIQWIDATRLGLTCENNPSLEDYVVLDAVSGRVLQRYSGLYFSWSPDRRVLAHVGPIVHFAPPSSQNYCLLLNDEPVYTRNCSSDVDSAPNSPERFPNIHTIEDPLVWSPDGGKIAFFVNVYDFLWNMSEKGEETRDIVNSRLFLAIVSIDGRALGYPIEPAYQSRINWLTNSLIELRSGAPGDTGRSFDLVSNPPKAIP